MLTGSHRALAAAVRSRASDRRHTALGYRLSQLGGTDPENA